MRLRALLLLPFVFGLSLVATAQTPVTLQPGVPVERKLSIGEVHEFLVNVEENNRVQLVVEQKGVDVVVKIASPDGKILSEHDTPNGDNGPERISFIATEAGKYRVSVCQYNIDAPVSGEYEIKLIEVRAATDEEIESGKNRDAARAKGIALLLDMRNEIAQLKSPNTRINAKITAANLLHNYDEKGASKYLLDAVADLKEMLAASDGDDENAMQEYAAVAQLRTEVVRLLVEIDPDAALNFLLSTAPKYSPYGNDYELASQESSLELSIVDRIAQKDPNRALEIARKNLKKVYSPSLMNTASQLGQKNPEQATELIHDISGKLLGEESLLNTVGAANLAMAVTTYYHSSNKPALVSEQEYKQIVQKLVREVLSYNVARNDARPGGDAIFSVIPGLRMLGPDLDKVVSGSAAAIEKKQAELSGNINNHWINQLQKLTTEISNGPVDGALEAIEKAPPEYREQLYLMLANKAAGSGDLNHAKQILNEHISNPYQRNQALRSLEQQELNRVVSSGKIEEALRKVGELRNPVDRAEQLRQLAMQIGADQKRETALSLLEQARGLLPPSPQAEDESEMAVLLEIAQAYSPYDSKRSFEMVEPLVEQFNDLCAAARTLEGFGFYHFDHDELDMHGEGSLTVIADQMSGVLGSLALVNFDRAKATADKLRLPEVRLHVYLQIAEQTITGQRPRPQE